MHNIWLVYPLIILITLYTFIQFVKETEKIKPEDIDISIWGVFLLCSIIPVVNFFSILVMVIARYYRCLLFIENFLYFIVKDRQLMKQIKNHRRVANE